MDMAVEFDASRLQLPRFRLPTAGDLCVPTAALPFEIDHYTQEGTLAPDSTLTHLHIVGALRSERRSYPLINSVTEFPGT